MATPGEQRTIRGIEVVAVDYNLTTDLCHACVFESSKNDHRSCSDIECQNVVWMHPLDAVVFRLVGGTT